VGGVQHILHLLLGLSALTLLGFEFSSPRFKFSPKHIQLAGQTVLARGESLNSGDKLVMKLILMPFRGGRRLRKKGYSKIFGIGGSYRGNAVESSRFLEVVRRPRSADAIDHPIQNGPQIPIQEIFIERLESIDDRVNFNARRERLSASSDEDERIVQAGWGAKEARF
jgi:hypothetical protein